MLTYKINDIKDKIPSLVNIEFTKNGFIFKKSKSQFILIQNGYSYFINLYYVSWGSHYSLDVGFYIGEHTTENILKSIIGESNKITMGNEVGYIYNSFDGKDIVHQSMSILLRQNEDVEAAAETLITYLNKIGKPYFERYSSIQNINLLFNNPPYDYIPAHIGGTLDCRCMRGLIIARLANDNRYDEILDVYDNLIKKTPLESIRDFEKVKSFLISY